MTLEFYQKYSVFQPINFIRKLFSPEIFNHLILPQGEDFLTSFYSSPRCEKTLEILNQMILFDSEKKQLTAIINDFYKIYKILGSITSLRIENARLRMCTQETTEMKEIRIEKFELDKQGETNSNTIMNHFTKVANKQDRFFNNNNTEINSHSNTINLENESLGDVKMIDNENAKNLKRTLPNKTSDTHKKIKVGNNSNIIFNNNSASVQSLSLHNSLGQAIFDKSSDLRR